VPPATTASDAGPRAAATAARRDAILAAALDCFARKGYAATSIDDVRRASGASVGSIYHHFGSKEELAAGIHVDAVRRYQEGFLAALTGEAQAEAGVKAVVRFHLAWVRRNRRLAGFMFARQEAAVLRQAEPGLRELNRRFAADAGAWVEPYVRSGAIRRLPPDVLFALLIGPSQELSRLWLAGRTETDPDRAAALLADSVWSSLQPAAASRQGGRK
jgi:AcrR family transcriptional regulator